MQIKSLYKDYFQKSRIFLYPMLEIKKGGSVTPIETYVAWKGQYTVDDAKLCTLYHLREDHEFRVFEKQKLLGNKLYHDFKQVETDKGVYVFDFSAMSEDWDMFKTGKYSKFSEAHKKKVLEYMGANNSNFAYYESFLYPEKYYRLYAEMLGIKEEHLRKVGQLCSVPEFDKETLEMSVINLDMINKLV